MHFYRKLHSFNVDTTFMTMFCSCFIDPVPSFSFIVRLCLLSGKQQSRIQGILKVGCKITSSNMNDLLNVFKVRSLKKAQPILNDPSHPLQSVFIMLPSEQRFIVPRCKTRSTNSFIPAAVNLVNV